MRISFLVVSVALSAALPAQALFTFAPIADATTDSARPNTNLGSDTELSFGKTSLSTAPAAGFRRAHVLFDLSTFIGSGLVPIRATFFWEQSRSNAAGCLDVSLHEVIAPWGEGTVTWANQPAHDPAVVSTTCVGSSFDLGVKEFELTRLVQRWFDGSAANNGFVIRDVNERTAGASRPGFGHSREFATVSRRPRLEIEFADPLGSGCGSGGLTPRLDVLSGSARLGDTLNLGATGFTPGSNVVGLFGLVPRVAPLPLATIGFPGCTLLVEPQLQAGLPQATAQGVDFAVGVPDLARLDGTTLFAQFVALSPAFLLEATGGLSIVLYE